MADETVVGIIGGTGLYNLEGLEETFEREVTTPFGEPSGKIVGGMLAGVKVIFVPRHGRGHRLLPSEINYRANICALKMLGAQWAVSVSAVGSLEEAAAPGDIVIPEQIIDRTRQRQSTFFGNGVAAHVSLADPYCPVLTKVLGDASSSHASENNYSVHLGGSFVCMEGPAFSTRAESHMYRGLGARIIGMTSLPEAKLAREAELAYGTLAMVTDYDCWKEDEQAVEVSHVMETLSRNAEHAKSILKDVVVALKDREPSEMAANALAAAILTPPEHIEPEARERLQPIIGRYL